MVPLQQIVVRSYDLGALSATDEAELCVKPSGGSTGSVRPRQ